LAGCIAVAALHNPCEISYGKSWIVLRDGPWDGKIVWANESFGATRVTLAGAVTSPVFLRYGGAFVVLGQFGARTLTSEFNRRPPVKDAG
jgi:hypothetical protein